MACQQNVSLQNVSLARNVPTIKSEFGNFQLFKSVRPYIVLYSFIPRNLLAS